MLQAVVRGGLGPATALPATFIDVIPNTEIRLICVANPVIEARTNDAGAVPALNGMSVEEYWCANVKPAVTAVCNSGYCARFSVKTLFAAVSAFVVSVDPDNDFAAASAAASKALCSRDLFRSTCAVSTANPAIASKANMPITTSTRAAPRSRRRAMAIARRFSRPQASKPACDRPPGFAQSSRQGWTYPG